MALEVLKYPVCPECDSYDIKTEGDIRWDIDKQDWVVDGNLYHKCKCGWQEYGGVIWREMKRQV